MAADSARGADFFISRAGADAHFAARIGLILEEAGYRVILQQWDFGHKNFMGEMHAALASDARVIALMSPPFLASKHCLAEALNSIAHDPLNTRERLIVMRVAECAPVGLFAALAYLDLLPLRGGDAGVLRDVVLASVREGRLKTAADVAQPFWRAPGTVLHDRVRAVPNFTGRKADLAGINTALADGAGHHSVAITQAAVRGLGGVGKSTLAIQYGWERRGDYAGVWWIDAASEATLTDGLAALGAVFMPQLAEIDDRGAAAREALRLIADGGFAKPWLIIYDNVARPDAIDGWTPRCGAQVLITSRWRDWRGRAADIELDRFTPEEAVGFLLKRTGRDDAEGAAQLAEDAGYLPLALDHAGAFCVETGDSFDDYRANLAGWLHESPEAADYPKAVFATFNLAIAEAVAKAPEAEPLMGLLAHFGPDAIPRWLIPEDVMEPMALRRAVGALSRVSLLAPVEGGVRGPAMTVHRLVQAVARARLGKAAADYAAQAVRLLYRGYDFHSGTVDTQHRRADWLPHALAALEQAPRDGEAARASFWVSNFAGDFQVSRGALEPARAAYDTGVKIARVRATAAPDNLDWQRDLSISLEEIGNVRVSQGNLPEALANYRQGRDIRERLVKANPDNAGWQRDLFVSLDKIGHVKVAQGNLPEALASYRRCRDIIERFAKADSSNALWQLDLSVSLINIGDVQVAQGNLPEALASYRQSRDIIEHFARADPSNAGRQRDLSVSVQKIGDVQVVQGNTPEALANYRQGRDIRERLARADPSNAPWQLDLSLSLQKIGDVQVAQGNFPEALESYRQSGNIRERVAKVDPSNAGWQRDLSVSLGSIGDVLVAQGNLPEALAGYRQSRDIFERLAKSDPGNAGWQRDLSVSLDKIGNVQIAQGNLPEALATYRQSRDIREHLARADLSNAGWQRDLSVSLQKIGNVLVAQGKLVVAQASYRQGRDIAERLAMADPGNAGWQRDLSVSLNELGDVQVAQGNLPEALAIYRQGRDIAERLTKADPGNAAWQRNLSVSLDKIGNIQIAQGNLPEALDSYRQSRELREGLAKANAGNAGCQADLAASYGKLGQVHAARGETTEALKLLRAGRAIVAPLAEAAGRQLWVGYLHGFDKEIAALERGGDGPPATQGTPAQTPPPRHGLLSRLIRRTT